ncbi:MAG: alpha/beta hydrolase [Eubacteriales bacterium]|nr:alpha/beta hydrolase [Eubacteriales bacterium]
MLKKSNPMGNPEFIRKIFTEGDDIRDAGLQTPAEIERVNDLVYGTDPVWNKLDIYRRKDIAAESNDPKPTIISIHGGAWVYGDKERYQFYCMDLAMRGFTVVNFTYRLAPEHRYPAAIEDINEVFWWIVKNQEKYQIDTDKLFVVGDSAGGQLASQYLALLTNPDYQKLIALNYPSDSLKVRGTALNCGMYDGKIFIKDALADSYFDGNPNNWLNQVDTLNYITSQFPPAFVMTSVHDFLREHAEPMYELLKSKGVPCEYHLYGSEIEKEIGHVFHLNIRHKEAIKCNDEECAFFRSLC